MTEIPFSVLSPLFVEYVQRFGSVYHERLAMTLMRGPVENEGARNSNLWVAAKLLDEGKEGTDELAEVLLWTLLADTRVDHRELAEALEVAPEVVARHLVQAASNPATRWPPEFVPDETAAALLSDALAAHGEPGAAPSVSAKG